MTFRQQQPVVSRVLDQPAAGLHQPLLQMLSDQLSIRLGSTNRRHRFPRLLEMQSSRYLCVILAHLVRKANAVEQEITGLYQAASQHDQFRDSAR